MAEPEMVDAINAALADRWAAMTETDDPRCFPENAEDWQWEAETIAAMFKRWNPGNFEPPLYTFRPGGLASESDYGAAAPEGGGS